MTARARSIHSLSVRAASRKIRRAVLGCVEALEARAMLSGTPFNYAITDADNHVLTLSVQGSTLQLVDADTTQGTSTTVSAAFDASAGVAISGGAGADVLQVDFANGTPFGAGGLSFAGGGPSNSLVLLNGSFFNNIYNEAAGTLQLDSKPLISFSNVGSVADLTRSANLYFETGTGNETLSLVDGPAVSGTPTTQFNSPSLTLDFANKGWVQLDSNGNDNITVNNTVADAAMYEFELDTLAASDTINVWATPSTVETDITSDYVSPPPPNGPDFVTVGNGSLAGIQGVLDVSDDANTEYLVIDDSADPMSRTVTYGSTPVMFRNAVEGLTPNPITFSASDVSSLTVKGGAGGNTFNVVNTIPNAANVIDAGAGNDTVHVQFVEGNAPLTINGQGGQDTVVVGLTTNNPGLEFGYSSIQSAVTVSNAGGQTELVIDTSTEPAAQTITAAGGTVTVTNQVPKLSSPTSVAIHYSANAGVGVTQVVLKAGAGADTLNLTPDAATAFLVDAGDPAVAPGDTLNVDFTSASGAALDAVTTAGYAHTYTFANRQPIAFTNIEAFTPVPVIASADLAVTLSGPAVVASGGLMLYTFTVTNLGPGAATGVLLSDALPAGVSFVSAQQFVSSVVNGVLTLNLGGLANGGVISGTFTLAAGAGPVSLNNSVSVSSAVPDPVLVNNVASVATQVLGGPPALGSVAVTSTINEGGTATLSGTLGEAAGEGTMYLTVNWGPGQGSNTYSFAEGTTTFSVTHAYPDNPAAPATSFPVSLVLKNSGGTATASTSVVVNDVAAVAQAITGPAAGVRGQALSFGDAFADAGVLDTHSAVINWGDGSTSPGAVTESGGAGTVAGSHVFKASGTYTVSVTITDKDGLSTTVSRSVQVGSVLVEPDPVLGGNMLVVGGTTGNDSIDVKSGGRGGLTVDINGTQTSVTGSLGRIVVYGQSGSDNIVVDRKVTNTAFLYAGSGGSTLQGGGGNNVLVGGAGNDSLVGGLGQNILIGGGGADTLAAGSAGDLLLAGSTAYNGNDAALAAILNEWTRASDSYATRIHDLQFGGGLNGSFVLNSSTLVNNSTRSLLLGGAGQDWFLDGANDTVSTKPHSTETITRIA